MNWAQWCPRIIIKGVQNIFWSSPPTQSISNLSYISCSFFFFSFLLASHIFRGEMAFCTAIGCSPYKRDFVLFFQLECWWAIHSYDNSCILLNINDRFLQQHHQKKKLFTCRVFNHHLVRALLHYWANHL